MDQRAVLSIYSSVEFKICSETCTALHLHRGPHLGCRPAQRVLPGGRPNVIPSGSRTDDTAVGQARHPGVRGFPIHPEPRFSSEPVNAHRGGSIGAADAGGRPSTLLLFARTPARTPVNVAPNVCAGGGHLVRPVRRRLPAALRVLRVRRPSTGPPGDVTGCASGPSACGRSLR